MPTDEILRKECRLGGETLCDKATIPDIVAILCPHAGELSTSQNGQAVIPYRKQMPPAFPIPNFRITRRSPKPFTESPGSLYSI